MKKTIKNIILFSLIAIEALILTNASSYALCYSSKTNGEEIHQRSCADAFQATGLLTVSFEDGGLAQAGTATLVAPDVLITAAHILVAPGRQIKEIFFEPQCSPGSTITHDMGQKPQNIWIHPGYEKETQKHDIAVIQLARPFKHIRPAQLQKELPDDFVSVRTTVVGYGRSGNNLAGPIFNDNKRRAGHMELFFDSAEKNFLYTPFTPKGKNEDGFIDSSDGSKYATIVAHGDSGGPAFIEIKGKPSARVLGIVVGNIKTYTDSDIFISARNRFMSIPYYYSWIESKLKLCNYHEADEDSTIPDYNNDPFNANSEYKDNQAAIAWNNIKEALWTAGKQGSEMLWSLYEYALNSGNKQALGDLFSAASGIGSQMLDEFIALHKELFE